MKITPADTELAKRFIFTPSVYGYGTSMAEARVSPTQLERLLKLNLIKISTDRYAGGVGDQSAPAKGWLRNVTTFLRTTK